MELSRVKSVLLKSLLVVTGVVLLFGNIGSIYPVLVEAEEAVEQEDSNQEAEENKDEESSNENEPSELLETINDIEEEEKEYKLYFLAGEDDFSTISGAFKDFLADYDNLSEEALIDNIEEFQLLVDDEKKVHSTYEEFYPGELGANQNQDLIELLEYIRFSDEFTKKDPFLFDTSGESFSTFSISPQAKNDIIINRIQGKDRIEVAINVSKQGWNSSNEVVIANGFKFTDALSGTPLAAYYDAPMLLVGNNGISANTLTEISRLNAKKVIILGGKNSVSESVDKTLRDKGLSVQRIAGEDRYDTSRMIAEEVISLAGSKSAHLVNGDAYADAVSISAVAGRNKHPILLTKSNQLHPEVKKITKQVKDWRIIGGPVSISENTENQLRKEVDNVDRIGGKDRYEVNKRVLNYWKIDSDHRYVGHGEAFADVLSASVLAARERNGVLLVNDSKTEIANVQDYARTRDLTRFTLLGGDATMTTNIINGFKNLNRKVVYIDPGHGGTDSGATYSGVQEKTLNLQIARRLRDELNATGNYEVIMSRDSDKTVELSSRPLDANAKNADIFVSVHHNAMGGVNAGTARGIETFVHHNTYPTQVPRNQLNTNDPRIRESAALADRVHAQVISRSGLRDRGVKGLNLNVLRTTQMPAILVEYGFIDNPTELSVIRQAQFQQAVAEATKIGINQYFGY